MLAYLFFSLPLGMTVVTGGMGRSDALCSLGGEVSFLGFFAILLLRCSPLAILVSCHDEERAAWPAAGFVDTEIGCFMKPEVAYAATTVWA